MNFRVQSSKVQSKLLPLCLFLRCTLFNTWTEKCSTPKSTLQRSIKSTQNEVRLLVCVCACIIWSVSESPGLMIRILVLNQDSAV